MKKSLIVDCLPDTACQSEPLIQTHSLMWELCHCIIKINEYLSLFESQKTPNSSLQTENQSIPALIHTPNDFFSLQIKQALIGRHRHRSAYLIILLFATQTDRMIMMHPNTAKLTHSLSVCVTQLDNP